MSHSSTRVPRTRDAATAPPAPGSQTIRSTCRRLVLPVLLAVVVSFMAISMSAAFTPGVFAAGSVSPAAAPGPVAAWSCRGVYHVVGRGETIYSIARRYGTTAYRIAVCNGLASYTVYVGQTLLVPTARS